jgi:hypothetical protein
MEECWRNIFVAINILITLYLIFRLKSIRGSRFGSSLQRKEAQKVHQILSNILTCSTLTNKNNGLSNSILTAQEPVIAYFDGFTRIFALKTRNNHFYHGRQKWFLIWQGRKDSNPRPTVLETATLPAELHPCVFALIL